MDDGVGVAAVENFHGVYMLYCLNPRYRGRTYIGYTVDPNRRIQQHNKGKQAGGAQRTSNRGPWEMVLIVHGFPNEISGLRFEWALQHPERSRRLQHIKKKTTKESRFEFNFRVLSHMLNVGPWNRLALTIQWLKPQYALDFCPSLLPPAHMPIQYGPVVSKKAQPAALSTLLSVISCIICGESIQDDVLQCLDPECSMRSHLICLSSHFLCREPDRMLPLEGCCPLCNKQYLWADLIRKMKGCYQSYSTIPNKIL